MINPKKIEEIAKQIADAVPPGVKSMAEGAEEKVKQILQAQLSKLDVVSREEFDIQTQVLAKTRAKLDALEAKISAMEMAASDAGTKDN